MNKNIIIIGAIAIGAYMLSQGKAIFSAHPMQRIAQKVAQKRIGQPITRSVHSSSTKSSTKSSNTKSGSTKNRKKNRENGSTKHRTKNKGTKSSDSVLCKKTKATNTTAAPNQKTDSFKTFFWCRKKPNNSILGE